MISVKRKAWIIASGVGIAAALLLYGYTAVTTLFIPKWSINPQALLISPASLALTVGGLCAYFTLIYAGTGALYTMLARRDASPVTVGQTALGGFLSTLSVLVFQYFLAVVNALVLNRSNVMIALGRLDRTGIAIQPGMESVIILVVLCSVSCAGMFLGGGLGAGAAAVTAAVVKPRSAAPRSISTRRST